MPKYATSFEKTGGYSIDAQTLVDLWKLASAFVGKSAEISVSLEGDHSIVVTDVAELTEDAFIRSNNIEAVSISGHDYSKEPTKALSISFRRRRWGEAASVSMSGSREECTVLRTEIESIIEGRRQRYATFIFPKNANFNLKEVLLNLGVLVIALFAVSHFKIDMDSLKGFAEFLGVYACVALAIRFVAALLARLMFPKLIFEIGKSASLGKSAEFWRVVVGVGFLVAIIGGVAVELLKLPFFHQS